MRELPIVVEPLGEEESEPCVCCQRPCYWGQGWLMSESRSLAAFWYRWADGHANVFHLAVARFDDKDHLIPGVACIKGTITSEDIVYTVLESDASPWSEFGHFGGIAPREAVLQDSAQVFALVDLIAAREDRLSDRIAAVIPRA